jgi:uncharacterized membrane protein
MSLLRNPVAALTATVVGFLLLFSQALIVLLGHSLNTTEKVILWVGLGIAVIGGLLLVLALVRVEDPPAAAASDG